MNELERSIEFYLSLQLTPDEFIKRFRAEHPEDLPLEVWGDLAEACGKSARWAEEQFFKQAHQLADRKTYRVVAYSISDKFVLCRTIIALYNNEQEAIDCIINSRETLKNTLLGIEEKV